MARRLRLATLAAAALVAAFGAAPAGADGLPVVGVDVGLTGVGTADGASRYVTLAVGRDTVVARIAQRGGRVLAARTVPGRLTIPAVAYDGSASGLSADGRTLALIVPREGFPRARATLALVDAKRLRVSKRILLDGDFSFDALSPDGRRVFLIEYTSPADPTRYAVRVWDRRAGRLLPEPVIDPAEPDEAMRGTPQNRATSPDGRWEYTLYAGVGQEPFVHALDTVAVEARCIDLEALEGRDVTRHRLAVSADGDRIDVVGPEGPDAVIDTATFAVGPAPEPAPAPAGASLPAGSDGAGSTGTWIAGAGAGGALLVGLALVARRRRVPGR